jgi:hypothetical protein
MNQFYVPDGPSAQRCHDSRDQQKSITISGVDSTDGQVKPYTGVVQSVEDFGASATLGRKWRVTMRVSESGAASMQQERSRG